MLDSFGRKINYVRISVTVRCDLRCKYCMPQTNPLFYNKKDILTLNNLKKISEALIKLGIKKIRITGGEPLIRKDIIEYIKFLGSKKVNNEIDELLLTTNGTQLSKYSESLFKYGVRRINVSLDSLINEKFNFITNGGVLEKVLEGIFSIKKKGIEVKINTVLIKNFNEDEIINLVKWCGEHNFKLSFIEIMPIGDVPMSRNKQYLPVSKAKEIINKEFKLEPSSLKSPGPSNYYYCKSLDTHIGFISPISDHFCLTCNRIRVTSNGIIYPCLGDNNSIDLNPFLNEQNDKKLIKTLQKIIYTKPEKHFFNINEKSYIKKRFMNTTGG